MDLHKPSEGTKSKLFTVIFGPEIQPKTMGYLKPWFVPWFLLVFCILPTKKQSFSCLWIF